jgi:hypothetical protein
MLADIILEMSFVQKQRCVLVVDEQLVEKDALVRFFGLSLYQKGMGIDDSRFGSSVFSMHC